MFFSNIYYPYTNIFVEIYEFEIWAKDYYLSLNEEFTMYQINNYIQNEEAILESSFSDMISKIIDKIISFIKKYWAKMKNIMKNISSTIKNKIKKVDDKNKSTDKNKRNNNGTITYYGIDYRKVIYADNWSNLDSTVAVMISRVETEIHLIRGHIDDILIGKKHDLSANVEHVKEYIFRDALKYITKIFGVDHINDISKDMIREYIFNDTKKEEVTINPEVYIKGYYKFMDNINKEMSKYDGILVDIIDDLKDIKNKIEKGQYKQYKFEKSYKQDITDDDVKKIILSFLSDIHSTIVDMLHLVDRVFVTEYAIVDRALNFLYKLVNAYSTE